MTTAEAMRPRNLAWAASLLLAALPAPSPAQSAFRPPSAEPCAAAPGVSAAQVLERGWRSAGLASTGDRVVHVSAADHEQQDYQSDRAYPPYFVNAVAREVWFDPRTGAERTAATMTGQGTGPAPAGQMLVSARAAWGLRDTLAVPLPTAMDGAQALRPLDAFAVLHDWRSAPDVRVAGRCVARDYPRIALTRRGVYGEERLLVAERSGLPVALVREEPHYLWGQVQARYEYVTWYGGGGMVYPMTVVRTIDGQVQTTRAMGEVARVARDSAPRLALPAGGAAMTAELPRFLQPLAPDTVRVGPSAFLLTNPGYNELVALVRDTVWVFDATQAEARARQDSAWIGRLFPGRHPVVLVVTDLAWPHVAGVRFWVASGATVVSHRISRPFLERVVAQRWTRAPDLLERRRATVRLRFTAVDGAVQRAGGGVRLAAIDGMATEGAVIAYLPGERFVWASDYVQSTTDPSVYTVEVVDAVRRAGWEPGRMAAEHVRMTPWPTIAALGTMDGDGA